MLTQATGSIAAHPPAGPGIPADEALRASTAGSSASAAVGSEPGLAHVAHVGPAMGGRLGIYVATPPDAAAEAELEASRVASRVRAWATFLTRFDAASDLMRLNGDPREVVPVGPTLSAALEWSAEARRMTGGIVDVTLLDARLAAETGDAPGAGNAPGAEADSVGELTWTIRRRSRGAVVTRRQGVRFDLDGIGKGWLADRALGLLWQVPGAVVDADGDLAIRVAPGDCWEIGIDDPRSPGTELAVLELKAPSGVLSERFGLATSGVSIHRWEHGDRASHHLIDPRTGEPADTDVIQATVLTRTARDAEALAKTAVILGTAAGMYFLDRARVLGAVLLTDRGEVLALPQTLDWLAT